MIDNRIEIIKKTKTCEMFDNDSPGTDKNITSYDKMFHFIELIIMKNIARNYLRTSYLFGGYMMRYNKFAS